MRSAHLDIMDRACAQYCIQMPRRRTGHDKTSEHAHVHIPGVGLLMKTENVAPMDSTGARSCDQMLRCDLRVGVAGGAARCCRTKLYCIWAFRDSGNPLPHPVRPSVSPTFLLSLLRIVLVLFHNFSRQCSHESSPLNKTPFRFLAVLRKPDVIFTFLEKHVAVTATSS